MKILHLEIESCLDCPHCKYVGSGFPMMLICDTDTVEFPHITRVTSEEYKNGFIVDPPKWCPLPEKQEINN